MRIIFVILVLTLAACSSGRHSASTSNGQSSAPATSAPTATGSAFATPPAGPPPADEEPGEGVPERPEAHKVTFAVRGDASRTDVSFTTPDGRRRRVVVSPPWSRTFTVRDGQRIAVTARSRGAGELTCTVRVDGELVKSSRSSGSPADTGCGDSLGF
jgi:hypothetical protein